MTEYRLDAYDPIAWIYNKYWGREIDTALHFLEKALLNHLPEKATILDLCCGCGQAAAVLSDKKFDVVGLDGSNKMLEHARKNSPESEFILADARAFNLDKSFDAVISLADALNHVMAIEDLKKVFSNVYAHLKPKGEFLFDLNMEKNFIDRWNDYSTCIIEPDHVLAMHVRYRKNIKRCEYKATIFTKANDGWSRSDVTLFQRSYSEDEVVHALTAAGFEKIKPIDATFEFGIRMKNHLYFHCKKPNK